MASVQFRSAAEALAAFDQQDCEAWSLWQGKQFMFKGIGRDELSGFIDLIEKSEISNASYTIAYYEDITDKKKINNKTPFDGSFNFVIHAQGNELVKYRNNLSGVSNELTSKISALENRLDKIAEALENDNSDDDDGENRLGIIGEILGHPSIAPIIPSLVQGLVTRLLTAAPAAQHQTTMNDQPLRKVSGISTPMNTANTASAIQENSDPVLQNAIERLKKADPKLRDHLSWLADLAERDINSFNYIISMFDKAMV